MIKTRNEEKRQEKIFQEIKSLFDFYLYCYFLLFIPNRSVTKLNANVAA